MAYRNVPKITDISKTMLQHEKTTLMGCLECDSGNFKFFVGQHLLTKCCPNLLLHHRHVESTIWKKFCNCNSNFKGGTFSDADRPTLAEAPMCFNSPLITCKGATRDKLIESSGGLRISYCVNKIQITKSYWKNTVRKIHLKV